MKTLNTMVALICLVVLMGCATIMNGREQDVGLSSNPTSAKVMIDGQIMGKTPLTVKLTRKDNHVVRFELPGYRPYETTLTRGVSGWVLGNIIFGGVVGLAIDAVTGGIYKLTPNQIHAALDKEDLSKASEGDRLYLAVVLSAEPTWEKVGMLCQVQ